jgi:branched-chain amino acid transport system substrate-binding protein
MKTIACALLALLATGIGASAQVSGDAVKIGVLTDHTGGFAYLVGKHSVTAAQMAVDDFGGTVLGKPITVITADHQNKADIAASISRKWFDTEGVDTITDVAGSAVALATQEIARSRGKVLLISGAATTELTGKACSATTSLSGTRSSAMRRPSWSRRAARPWARSASRSAPRTSRPICFRHRPRRRR